MLPFETVEVETQRARKRKTRLSKYRNVFQAQVNDCLSTFSQCPTALKPLQSHIYVESQIYKELIRGALYIKVSKEHIGTNERDRFVDNIVLP
ncbi:hypothetical protein V6N13_060840 [Hibiscus sabdariffa]|uniref:Uncharacterized protein n=1 Tax=Hibiscus sabdariffa TaxID=183260 RepID=A0ABR2P6X8_9ROSI